MRAWWRRRFPLSNKTETRDAVPVFRPLSEAEKSALEVGLNLAARVSGVPRPLGIHNVQDLYDGFLAERLEREDALIALGLSFGEQIVRTADFEWVRVSDEYGEETCVAPRGKTVHCAPISMIKKRLMRGEVVDLARLRDHTIEVILKSLADGGVADR